MLDRSRLMLGTLFARLAGRIRIAAICQRSTCLRIRPCTTPRNTVTFACTGGDDVHFGLLRRAGTFGDHSPVVMTVPMADDSPDDTNFVVGSNLHEFLCLGCTHGYFRLETMAYSWFNEFLDELKTEPEDPEAYSAYRERFALEPWTDVESRLTELQRSIKPDLAFPLPKN